MSGIQKLIGEYASLEEDGLLPEMAAEEIMQINAESVISTKNPESLPGLNEKAKP